MYRQYTFEERLEIVLKIKSGYPLKRLCKELGLDRDFVRDWLQKYEEHGESGLFRKAIKDVDGAEKEHFVRLFLEKSIPLRQIYVPNGITLQNPQETDTQYLADFSIYAMHHICTTK